MTHLCHIFKFCLAGRVKVMSNYTEPKAYHLISLSPFMLKTMKKLMDKHIGDDILGLCPVRQYQFGYQPGKSTKTTVSYDHTLRKQRQTGMIYVELS